jgi:glycosyltransferase involved in cell wall biosynthesis
MRWSSIGGTEIATMRLSQAMAPRNIKSIAFCLQNAGELRGTFEKAGILTESYELPNPSIRRGLTFFRQSRALAKQFKMHGIDLVHFADFNAAFNCSFAASLAGLRCITHVRTCYDDLTARERFFTLPVSKYIFVSHEARRRFGLKISDGQSCVVYDGIDIHGEGNSPAYTANLRAEFGLPQSTKIIGMVARLAAVKDYETLAMAASRLSSEEPDFRIVIIGDNCSTAAREHFETVVAYIKKVGVAHRFIFLGHRSDVLDLYKQLDIVVLSTHREGFGLCILEAMAASRPVVATAVGGILELIEDGQTGLLCAPRDPQSLANALGSVLKDDALAQKLGRAARRRVEREFTVEKFSKDIEAVYLKTMQEFRNRN